VTHLRHDRACMPSEPVPPGTSPEACPHGPLAILPYLFLRRVSSSRARSAVPCQAWRRCAPGVPRRCARRACTTPGAVWLLAGATGGSFLLTYGTQHGTIAPSRIFLFGHLHVP
jgi:hypothetical protein